MLKNATRPLARPPPALLVNRRLPISKNHAVTKTK
jgi:hypothetical protein